MKTIWCLGSINIDLFYDVPHIPAPGETLAATGHSEGLGGKGANQSVAAAKAGAPVHHIGAIGANSAWVIERLESFGVDTTHIAHSTDPTGHAIINVASDGENAIVILPGANRSLAEDGITAALSNAQPGDLLLLQNETNLQPETAQKASEIGMRVLYSAAPFDAEAVRAVLPHIDMLLLNEVEAQQLEKALEQSLYELPIKHIVITLGPNGARWISTQSGDTIDTPGIKVDAVDTTGAGDTFAGYLAAALSRDFTPSEAMAFAGRAAALKVTKKGTADAIPTLAEVEAFDP
ncbi:MAG: ribokinase [Boseongicola sp.]|nr:ribokinase [Boseongicola sp.]